MSDCSGTNSDDGSFGDWDAPNEDLPILSLLGTSATHATEAGVWAELAASTGFDMSTRKSWGVYDMVRVVNYLRRAVAGVAAGDCVGVLKAALEEEHLAPGAPLWQDDTLLVPVLEDDALIMAVVSRGGEEGEEDGSGSGSGSGSGGGGGGGGGGAGATPSAPAPTGGVVGEDDPATLRAELTRARELLRLLSSEEDTPAVDPATSPHAGTKGQDNLTYYFESYSSGTGIHRTMLADKPRTEAYREAIQAPMGPGGGNWVQGKRVLDLGCGTGILSLFAADAGAKAVVALDASSVIDDAASIVRLNGKGGKIACVLGRLEESPLHRVVTEEEAGPGAKVGGTGSQSFAVLTGSLLPLDGAPPMGPTFDVIVSEWMGYALLYESMLASVLVARDRHLRPGGVLLPSSATVFVGAVSDGVLWGNRVNWWKDVYGYDMTPMARHGWPDPLVEDLPAESLASVHPHATLVNLRMATMRPEEQDVMHKPWSLTLHRNANSVASEDGLGIVVHALTIWFDVGFAFDPYQPGGQGGGGAVDAASGETQGVGEEEEEEGDCPPAEAVVEGGTHTNQHPSHSSSSPPPPPAVVLSTSPAATHGHWHHTTLVFKEPFVGYPGKVINGVLSMHRDAANPRTYHFNATVKGVKPGGGDVVQKWFMD